MCVLQFVFLLLSLTFDAALEGGDSAGARGERFGQRLQRAPSLRPLFFFFFFFTGCAPAPRCRLPSLSCPISASSPGATTWPSLRPCS